MPQEMSRRKESIEILNDAEYNIINIKKDGKVTAVVYDKAGKVIKDKPKETEKEKAIKKEESQALLHRVDLTKKLMSLWKEDFLSDKEFDLFFFIATSFKLKEPQEAYSSYFKEIENKINVLVDNDLLLKEEAEMLLSIGALYLRYLRLDEGDRN